MPGDYSNCPKCGRRCAASGELTIDDCDGRGPRTFPVYQCDECITPGGGDYEGLEFSLTWFVRDGGAVVVPEATLEDCGGGDAGGGLA